MSSDRRSGMSVARGARKTTRDDSSRAEMGTEIEASDTLAPASRRAGIHRDEPDLAIGIERAGAPPERTALVTTLTVGSDSGRTHLPRVEVCAKALGASVGIAGIDRRSVVGLARSEAIAAVVSQSLALHDLRF